jgi:acetylornithine deacetylase/succinyl-diaminopimelate desuccinylase-like protein
LILGHTDVVPVGDGWTTDPYGGVVKDGRIYGRGASDMKGGLAAALVAMAALRGAGLSGPIELAAVVDEEETGKGIRAYVDHARRTATGSNNSQPPDRAPDSGGDPLDRAIAGNDSGSLGRTVTGTNDSQSPHRVADSGGDSPDRAIARTDDAQSPDGVADSGGDPLDRAVAGTDDSQSPDHAVGGACFSGVYHGRAD